MSERTDVCRIVIHETLNGTFYIPERLVYKRRWFYECGYEWEPFKIVTRKDFFYYDLKNRTFERLPKYEFECNKLKSIKVAEYFCSEYMRVTYGGKTVKTWSVDDV